MHLKILSDNPPRKIILTGVILICTSSSLLLLFNQRTLYVCVHTGWNHSWPQQYFIYDSLIAEPSKQDFMWTLFSIIEFMYHLQRVQKLSTSKVSVSWQHAWHKLLVSTLNCVITSNDEQLTKHTFGKFWNLNLSIRSSLSWIQHLHLSTSLRELLWKTFG